IFWDESIDLLKIIGLILLMLSFYLINIFGELRGKIKYQWLLYCSLTFLFNGAVPSLLKWHEVLLPNKELFLFLFIGFSVSSIASFLFIFIFSFIEKNNSNLSLLKLPCESWFIIIGIAIST